ncbi:MAG: ABC transporter permease [Saprospiraceae bacterium]|nr:ABC transporter permease [Saprospiraceae bacterium]
MKNNPQPPRWADRFLGWFCAEELLEEIQGDLHEAFYHRQQHQGLFHAQWAYIKDVFAFFGPYAFEKYSRTKQFLPMFDNYFKIALRNILHRKSFTAINFLGLSIGICALLSIGLYLQHEYSFDKHVPHHERVYRLQSKYRDQTYTNMHFSDYYSSSAESQLQLIRFLEEDEAVDVACHFVPSYTAIGGNDQYYVEIQDRRFVAQDVLYTNTGKRFQTIFPQTFLQGNPATAFSEYNSIILTEKLANRWFGDTWKQQSVIGTTMTIREELYTLGGIVADPPSQQHFDFDWIVYQQEIPSWGAYTYLKLTEQASFPDFLGRLNQQIDQVYPGYSEDVLRKGIEGVPLTEIHFTEGNLYEIKAVANPAYLSTFGWIGMIILLIIWINYTNLSIAMYTDRQKELGIRKVMGARPFDISMQLVAEASLLALLSFPFCYLLLHLTLPYFGEILGTGLGRANLNHPLTLLSLFSLLLLTGIISSLYPAVTYGRKSLVHLMGDKIKSAFGYKYLNFRNVLLTSQFVMVVGLLSVSLFIYQQMQFILNKDLGFEKEGVVYFGVDGAEKYQALRQKLAQIPEVNSIGANGVPGEQMYNQLTYKLKDAEVTLSDGTQQYLDWGSIQTLGIECPPCQALAEGKERIFVINRTAAEKLAKTRGISPEELVGTTLVTEPEWENEEHGFGIPHLIDGIIDDYKYFSLKHPNQSLLLDIVRQPEWVYEVLVKVQTDDWRQSMRRIEQAYGTIETVRPFDPGFLSERLEKLYQNERTAGQLMGGLTLTVVILAFMGLAGMVSYLAFGRQREIGIRKVLGASVGQILFLFNKEFMLLLGIATLITLPIALVVSQNWLDNFAYSIDPKPWVVLLASGIILLLLIVLVSLQARKAAIKRPVEVIRNVN